MVSTNYTVNFLSRVIFAIEFPSIKKEEFNLKEFRDLIKEDFPIMKEQKSPVISLHIDEKQKVDSKIDEDLIWLFFNKNKTMTVSLDNARLSLEFVRYTNFTEFMEKIKLLVESLFQIYPDIFSTRIGLRYINEIKLPGVEDILNWNEYICEDLIKASNLFQSTRESIIKNIIRIEVSGENYNLNFQCGMPNSVYPSEIIRKEFTLDYDCYTEESLEKIKILEKVEKFHNIIKLLFEKSIKDELRKEMGGV